MPNLSKIITGFAIFALLWLSALEPCIAGNILKDSDYSIGVGTWISNGRTDWNHDATAASSIYGNPTSKLSYDNQSSMVYEINAKMRLPEMFFIRANAGFGGIDNGTLTDEDFLSSGGADFLASSSSSDIVGNNLWYVNVDVGYSYPFNSSLGMNFVSAYIGYQRWEESSDAEGVTYNNCTVSGFILGICLPAGTATRQGEVVVSNEVEWDSLRLGLEAELALAENLFLEVGGEYVPYARMRNRDTHHLRSDLAVPGFKMFGTGKGFNIQVALKYMIYEKFFLSAGYRFRRLTSSGTVSIYSVTGSVSSYPLNDLDSQRHGLTLTLSHEF